MKKLAFKLRFLCPRFGLKALTFDIISTQENVLAFSYKSNDYLMNMPTLECVCVIQNNGQTLV